MRISVRQLFDSLPGFVARHERFIFTTFARILAVGCILVAAWFAWKLAGQLAM